ncbi:hypothetical protein D3C86_1380080 [compost metagenome]
MRWTKAELFGWLNDAAVEVVIRRPSAHAITVTHELVAGVRQELPEDGIQLLDVPRNTAGRPIRRVDRQLLDDQRPDWVTQAAGTTKHYTYDDRVSTEFYVYPPATAGAQVELLYSAPPPSVADDEDQLQLSRIYTSPLLSFMLYRALAKDSEFADGALAATHFQAFSEAIGAHGAVASAASPNVGSV